MNRIVKYLKEIPEDRKSSRELFGENEIQANRLGAIVLFISGIFLLLIYQLTLVGVFPLMIDTIWGPAMQGIIEIAVILMVVCFVKRDTWWLKYLLLSGMVIVYARLDMLLTHKAAILMIIPVVFSSRYFSRRLTVFTAVLSVAAFLVSAYFGATLGMIDLNIVTMPAGVTFTSTGGFLGDAVLNAGVSENMLRANTIMYNYIPKLMMFLIAAMISTNIADTGYKMVVTQHIKDQKTQAIKTELDLARKIQIGFLPNTFSPFPNHPEIDIYALMDPAREVGGDFYDFYFTGDDRLVLLMADVSGKGIPAALFMMVSKLLIKNEMMNSGSPALALRRVSKRINSRNEEGMFVTVWLGIVDLKTGVVKAVNAGHEYPIIKEPDGDFEIMHDKHGFVVGVLDKVEYTEYEFTMKPGSKLFIYTDGLPEAANEKFELFGMERTLAAVNEVKDEDPRSILAGVRKSVEKYVGAAEQFDDLTMLCFEYKDRKEE